MSFLKCILLFVGLCCFNLHATLNHKDIAEKVSCFSGNFKDAETWINWLAGQKNKTYNEEQKLSMSARFNGFYDHVECVDFIYKSDGNYVQGYYLKPKNTKQTKLPVIIYNRGGNGYFGHVSFPKKALFLAQYAKAGYLVMGTNYRGGGVSGAFKQKQWFHQNNGKDEFAGADINDVLKLIDIVNTMPEADNNRIAMMGWSRGGSQTYNTLQLTDQIKAAVVIAGPTDYLKGLSWRGEMENVYRNRIPKYDLNKDLELTKRSIVNNLDKLPENVPILMVHGDKDTKVDIKHAYLLEHELKRLSRPHKLIVYKGDNHGLRQHRAELFTDTINWLETHM